MSTQHSPTAIPLPPEPWGRKMRRAREDVADLTLGEAAQLASHYTLTSPSTISRMEQLDAAPPAVGRHRSTRQTAYVLLVAYGMDPAEFGLSVSDLPPGTRIARRTPSELVESPTVWNAA